MQRKVGSRKGLKRKPRRERSERGVAVESLTRSEAEGYAQNIKNNIENTRTFALPHKQNSYTFIMKRKMYLFVSLIGILVLITCFLIFYYSKRTVEYSLEETLSYPEKNNAMYDICIIWNTLPSEYKLSQLIDRDSSFIYLKKYLGNLDFEKNGYIISNQRKITSIYWSPHLADKYYTITDCQSLPVHVEFDTIVNNNIYIYKLKKDKYRLLAPY